MENQMDEREEYLERVNDLEGTSCFNCPEGEYRTGKTTRTLERGETVLVVKEVPALVCDKCGDAAFSEAVSERLETLINDASSTGVESEVRRFQFPEQHRRPASA